MEDLVIHKAGVEPRQVQGVQVVTERKDPPREAVVGEAAIVPTAALYELLYQCLHDGWKTKILMGKMNFHEALNWGSSRVQKLRRIMRHQLTE